MSTNQVKTQQIAASVVSSFIARAEESSDVNQLAFNNIVKATLETLGFSQCFEQLLVRKHFQLPEILAVFSKSSKECVFDTYGHTDDQFQDMTDISLTDDVMGIALSRSRLMEQLIREAYDQSQML